MAFKAALRNTGVAAHFRAATSSLSAAESNLARDTPHLQSGLHLWNTNFSSKLFKVHAPRDFRNRVYKGKLTHASITTQTNLDFVVLLHAGGVRPSCVLCPCCTRRQDRYSSSGVQGLVLSCARIAR